jgi:hypothetical protein
MLSNDRTVDGDNRVRLTLTMAKLDFGAVLLLLTGPRWSGIGGGKTRQVL